jgi:integrase/recombinase XerD
MSRRKNELNQREIRIMETKVKTYVESFAAALDLFLKDCEIRNLRPHTIRYYQNEIHACLNQLREQGINVETLSPVLVTQEHIKENVIAYMRHQKGLRIVTINTRLRALRAFFNYLFKAKHIPQNPFDGITLLKDRKTVIATFSKEQLNKLFKQPDLKTFTGVRDYTILMLLLETGIRASELVGISIEDILWEDDLIIIRQSKSYRQRQVPITKPMRQQLKKYINIRGSIETNALFVTVDSNPLSKRGLQNQIKKYGNEAGIKGVRCSPHTFRHTFAKLSVQNGANIFELQAILGHTSFEIVKTYVNLFGNDVRDRHREFSPLRMLDNLINP